MAVLSALSDAVDARPYMRGHAGRVTRLAELVAVRLGWKRSRLAMLRVGGRLHDVGKLAIDERILRKPGPLTPDEFAEIRRHPIEGARMIAPVDCFDDAFPYVLYHHERWDGGGYPAGLAGPDIPVEARVLAVADAFDAMTSVRPYRSALSTTQALDEIDRCAGTQFDPELARLFVVVAERRSAAAVG